jgi:quaternary ammonium compound-resistance protein SugE
MSGWIFLFLASIFEACWTFTLKALDMKKVFAIRPSTLFTMESGKALLPLALYIILGLSNVLAVTKAMKTIPAATAFAVWMGLALILIKIVDVLYFKEGTSALQIIFTGCILVGIVGLRWIEAKPAM